MTAIPELKNYYGLVRESFSNNEFPKADKVPKRKLTDEEKDIIKRAKTFLKHYQPKNSDPGELKLIYRMIQQALEDLVFSLKNRGLIQTAKSIRAEIFLNNTHGDLESWLQLTPWPTDEVLLGLRLIAKKFHELREDNWKGVPVYWDLKDFSKY